MMFYAFNKVPIFIDKTNASMEGMGVAGSKKEN